MEALQIDLQLDLWLGLITVTLTGKPCWSTYDLWLGLITVTLTGKPYWSTYDLTYDLAWLHWGLQGSLTDWLMAWSDYAEAYREALLINLRQLMT